MALTPKAFETLLMLVRERHRGVTKAELLDAVWADTAVTENTLTQRIKELRDALGDSVQDPIYVRTIPRIGYQFVGTVTEEGSAPVPEAPPSIASPLPSARPWKWIAVAGTLAVAVAAGLLLWQWRGRDRTEMQLRLVSSFPGSHGNPSLSPDGTMVSFVMEVDGLPQVFVASIGAGQPLQITNGDVAASRPRWSPLGDQIVFERRGQGIWSVPPLGGTPRRIIERGASPSFSADGRTLVFERGPNDARTERWGLWLADSNGSNPRAVEGTPDKIFWSERSWPALSPDGTMIAFFRQSAGPTGDLWVVNVSGGGARQLTHDEREGGAPAWTADSRAVIFPSERRGSRTLWRVEMNGAASPLTTGSGADDEPSLSADGRRLIYVNRRNRSAVKVAAAAGAASTIIEGPSMLWLPHVSPDGRRVAYFADVNGDMHIFTAAIDGTDVKQITHGDHRQNIHPTWSADGATLYFYGRTIGAADPSPAWRSISTSGEGETSVVQGWTWATHNNAHIDSTGRYILYTRIGADTGDYSRDTTYVRDIAAGTERALPGPHLHGAQWSPDGHRIAGHRHDGSIVVCDAGTGDCRKVAEGTSALWCADGQHLYFLRRAPPNRASVLRVDLSNGLEEPVTEIGPLHALAPAVSLTPDHRIVFTEFAQGRGELWLIELP